MKHLLVLLLFASGCWTGDYLFQQGRGQLKLLQSRRKIVDVLADPTVDARTKERLRLALAARRFGIEVLGLRGGDSYTRFLDTRGQPVAWNVSAAPKDRLRPYLHRFPITGAIPYLGFFKEADARREAARLAQKQLDVFVRPVSGYSTLGITSDPVYSSMLEGSPAHIVEVVLHEMLHGTLYLPGHSEWNESLATFVGYNGAALFFSMTGGEGDARKVLAEAQARQERQAQFSRWLEPILKELEALYARPIPREEKLRLREDVFARAKAKLLEMFPPPPGRPPVGLAAQPLNNAVLVAHAVYHRSTPEHQRLFKKVGYDLRAFIALYKYAVENTEQPIAWLKRR